MNKGVLTLISLALAVMIGLFTIFNFGISGKNIRVYAQTEDAIFFYPICPVCKSKGTLCSTVVLSGENHISKHVCEKCWISFEAEVRG